MQDGVGMNGGQEPVRSVNWNCRVHRGVSGNFLRSRCREETRRTSVHECRSHNMRKLTLTSLISTVLMAPAVMAIGLGGVSVPTPSLPSPSLPSTSAAGQVGGYVNAATD